MIYKIPSYSINPEVDHLFLQKNEVKQEMNKVIGTSPAVTGVKIRTKTLEDKDEFKCQVPDMYRALTDTAVSISYWHF